MVAMGKKEILRGKNREAIVVKMLNLYLVEYLITSTVL